MIGEYQLDIFIIWFMALTSWKNQQSPVSGFLQEGWEYYMVTARIHAKSLSVMPYSLQRYEL